MCPCFFLVKQHYLFRNRSFKASWGPPYTIWFPFPLFTSLLAAIRYPSVAVTLFWRVLSFKCCCQLPHSCEKALSSCFQVAVVAWPSTIAQWRLLIKSRRIQNLCSFFELTDWQGFVQSLSSRAVAKYYAKVSAETWDFLVLPSRVACSHPQSIKHYGGLHKQMLHSLAKSKQQIHRVLVQEPIWALSSVFSQGKNLQKHMGIIQAKELQFLAKPFPKQSVNKECK